MKKHMAEKMMEGKRPKDPQDPRKGTSKIAPKKEHYFYDQPILPDRQQEYIENLLKKYKNESANEELKKKIWDELQHEKQLGNITIPFKVVLRQDFYRRYPPSVEIILDTKV